MSNAPTIPRWVIYVLAAALLLALLPTLTWFDFDESMEGVAVATALESKREGHYAVPILNGKPRVRKPPLATWIAMAGIRPETIDKLSDTSAQAREAAFRDLAWQVRWTGALTACLLALGAAELGRLVGGNALGVMTFLVVASCGLFLRHSRIASFDTQLALWVTWTNVFLLRALLTRRWWLNFSLAGVTLGLALMSKGPIGVIQSVIPMALAAWWLSRSSSFGEGSKNPAFHDSNEKQGSSNPRQTKIAFPILVGLLISLAIALPWTIWILKTVPNAYNTWEAETLRSQGAAQGFDSAFEYHKIIKLMLPWSFIFLLGIVMAVARAWKDRRSVIVVPVMLLLVPVFIMSWFPDKQDRYLLPMVAPACILTAAATLGLSQLLVERKARWIIQLLVLAHVLLIGVFAVRWSIVGGWVRVVDSQLQVFGRVIAMKPKDVLDLTESWPTFSTTVAIITLVILFGTWIAGILLHRRWVWALGAMTAIVGLGSDSLKLYGKPQEQNSVPDMARLLANEYPRVPIYSVKTSPPSDLLIYTNRRVNRVSEWNELPRGGPKIVLTQRHGKKELLLPPPRPDAKHIDHKRRMNQWWDAWWLPE